MLSYSKFINYNLINEGSLNNPQNLYWNHQLENILAKDWTEINTARYSGGKYNINFKAGQDQYDYYSVIVEGKNIGDDFYYLEDNVSEKFIKKFKTEFWKNASEYFKKLKYTPKCLGNLSHVRDAEKYNL